LTNPRPELADIDSTQDALPIPNEGLTEVLSSWSGRGDLFEALAAIEPEDFEFARTWTRRDIERRANRVLFARLEPMLGQLPIRLDAWLDALPAESYRERILTLVPSANTIWVRTRQQFGWPPSRFAGRSRLRVADELIVTTLRWSIDSILRVRDDALAMEPRIDEGVSHQLRVLVELRDTEPVSYAIPVTPTKIDLKSLSLEGHPWNALAPVATLLRSAERSLEELSRTVLVPDAEFRWRLFHLAVLGTVLMAFRSINLLGVSLAPLSATGGRPAYTIQGSPDRAWDIWFEAGGFWKFYGIESPYVGATRALPSSGRPLSPDIAVLALRERALILECKFSAASSYVSTGVTKAMAYALEAKTALAEEIDAWTVVPQGTISGATSVKTAAGTIGICMPSDIAGLVKRMVFG
jgi:hypothetical protein